MDCWCEPEVEWVDEDTGLPYPNGPIVIHNAADSRENTLRPDAKKPWKAEVH